MNTNDELDELCTDTPGDRFDHHRERLEGRDLPVAGARDAKAPGAVGL